MSTNIITSVNQIEKSLCAYKSNLLNCNSPELALELTQDHQEYITQMFQKIQTEVLLQMREHILCNRTEHTPELLIPVWSQLIKLGFTESQAIKHGISTAEYHSYLEGGL